MDVDTDQLDAIIEKYNGDRSYMLAMFQDVQRLYRYLPKQAIYHICKRLEVPFSKGYEVATFYKALSLKPRGRHTIHVCLGTACHFRGGPNILEVFERELKIKTGETTKDGNFTVETVNCLGACALAPLVRVDEQDFGKATQALVKKIIDEFRDEVKS
ncbi:MAG TPA: NAD(P)H-dependent oxidoreductase subunit E [Syntrophorhabdaceae bacterium]|nr:NAD(P)H-dependent oxidoreductase subunit E [Syntrophorhabdaceae bacterium]